MAYEGKPAREFIDMEIVQQHLGLAADHLGAAVRQRFARSGDGVFRHFNSLQLDSPLEAIFLLWFWACAEACGQHERLELRPQQEVTTEGKLYRVDFIVEPISPYDVSLLATRWKPVAVEVDGHAFHERTREQVAIRDSRDRALQAAGWHIFHFSYSEFVSSPATCVEEVIEFSIRQLNGTK